jgi:flagellar biosynthetic protein FliQ
MTPGSFTPDGVAHIVGQMFVAAFWIAAPLLGIGFVTGIVVSLIQVLTSIQDSGFNAIPRLIAFLGGSLLMMPWMVHKAMSYAIGILGDLSSYGR